MSTQPSLQEFTLFGVLPTELRCKIWQIAFSYPRVVCVDLEQARISGITQLWMKRKVPALFGISRESRGIALDLYSQAQIFGRGGFAYQLTMNFFVDTLYISCGRDQDNLPPLALRELLGNWAADLRHLAINYRFFRIPAEELWEPGREGFCKRLVNILKLFPGLETLGVVVGEAIYEGDISLEVPKKTSVPAHVVVSIVRHYSVSSSQENSWEALEGDIYELFQQAIGSKDTRIPEVRIRVVEHRN